MIKYVLGSFMSLSLLSGCATPKVEPVTSVEVRTIEVPRPSPIVPSVDQLRLRPVNWIIITPDNIEESFAKIQSGEVVFFAVTTQGYENIALNLSDIRAMIEQQKKIIAIYREQFR